MPDLAEAAAAVQAANPLPVTAPSLASEAVAVPDPGTATKGTAEGAADSATPAPEGKPPTDAPPSTDFKPVFDATKLVIPEGMKTDDPLFQGFSQTLADAKLDPQARGQKLLDLYKDGVKAVGEANTKAWTDLNDKWVKEVKADPEIGGTKFESTKTTIAKAIDSMGPKEATAFRQALDMTGAGNNPAIWRGLAKLAASITEGGHVQGQPAAQSAKPSVKEAFYPNSPDMK